MVSRCSKLQEIVRPNCSRLPTGVNPSAKRTQLRESPKPHSAVRSRHSLALGRTCSSEFQGLLGVSPVLEEIDSALSLLQDSDQAIIKVRGAHVFTGVKF